MPTHEPVTEAIFALLERQNEALVEVLPERSPLRGKLQTDLASARLVRTFIAQQPPEKAKTDWGKLATLLIPTVTLMLIIVAELLGIDWRGVVP